MGHFVDIASLLALFHLNNCNGLRILTPEDYGIRSLNNMGLDPLTRFSLTFQVVACSDAYVAFFDDISGPSNYRYQIVFGGWNNTRSEIRLGQNTVVYELHAPLDCCSFKAFWVSWGDSTLKAGYGFNVGESALFEVFNTRMARVTQVGISTGWKNRGVWAMSLDNVPLMPKDYVIDGYVGCNKERVTYFIPAYPTSSTIFHSTSSKVFHSTSSEAVSPSSSEIMYPSSSEIVYPSSSEIVYPSSSEIVYPSSSEIVYPSLSEIGHPTSSETGNVSSSETVYPESSENVESSLNVDCIESQTCRKGTFTPSASFGPVMTSELVSMTPETSVLTSLMSPQTNVSSLGESDITFLVTSHLMTSLPILTALQSSAGTPDLTLMTPASFPMTSSLDTVTSSWLDLSDSVRASFTSVQKLTPPSTTSILDMTSSPEVTSTTPWSVTVLTTPDINTCVGCPCVWPLYGMVNLTLDQKIERIRESLTLVKSNLSAVRRRLTSANDVRPSSRYMGASGATILALVTGLIFLADIQRILVFFMDRKKNDQRTRLAKTPSDTSSC